MKRRALPFTIIFFLFLLPAFAKKRPWYKGKITLTDGEVLAGELTYDPEKNVVIQKEGTESEREFAANEVTRFEYFDSKRIKQVVFITLPFGEGMQGMSPTFKLFAFQRGM